MTQNGGVASFSPDDPDAAVKYPIDDIMDARQIVTGPDGNLWTVSGENVIRIPAANPAGSTSFPVLVAGRDIDAGKDGLLWVADFGSQVVSLTTDGDATAYSTGSNSGLQAIAAGPKGQVAYADPISNPQKVGRITTGGTGQEDRRTRRSVRCGVRRRQGVLDPALRGRRPGAPDAPTATCAPSAGSARTPARGGSPRAWTTPSGSRSTARTRSPG